MTRAIPTLLFRRKSDSRAVVPFTEPDAEFPVAKPRSWIARELRSMATDHATAARGLAKEQIERRRRGPQPWAVIKLYRECEIRTISRGRKSEIKAWVGTIAAIALLLALAGCAADTKTIPASYSPALTFTLSHWQECSDGSSAQCMVVEMADGWYELGNPSRIGDVGYY